VHPLGSPEEREKYAEWLRSLKVGDEVRYDRNSWGSSRLWTVTKIAKITPTGMFRLADGALFYSNGRGRGDYSYRCLLPVDEAFKAEQARKNAIRYLNDYDFSRLSSEDLLKVLEIVKSYDQPSEK